MLLALWWLISASLLTVVKWWDGSAAVGEPFARIADTFYCWFALLVYAMIRASSRTAFDRIRPVLAMDDDEAARLRLHIATMTPVTALVCGVVGAGLGIAAFAADPVARDLASSSFGATVVVVGLLYVSSVVFAIPALVQMVRQLRLVALLHRRVRSVDIFRPWPVHAFSRLTALSGTLALVAAAYAMVTNPATLTNPVWVVLVPGAVVLAVLAFFLPLRGMHLRLQQERRQLLDENAGRTLAVTVDLDAAVDGRAYERIPELKAVLGALDEARGRIEKASTWPWAPATLRGFTTALLVPVLVWLLTKILATTLGL